MNNTDKGELEQRIKEADTIPALDKLRMDLVQAKDNRLLVMWQVKFWERKKKYSYAEVQALCSQARIDVLRNLAQKHLGTDRKTIDKNDLYDSIAYEINAARIQAKETEGDKS